jgi:hypothetical protein
VTNPWIGISSNTSKQALQKYDGSKLTTLATAGTSLFPSNNALYTFKLDMQVISYGSTATVNVYVNGALHINYSGNVTVSGLSKLDAFGVGNFTTRGNPLLKVSEIITADEDTRSMSLVTLAPNAAGSTDNWTGAYTDVSESRFLTPRLPPQTPLHKTSNST